MTAEFWQYDARLGRRWNIDPKPSADVSVYATYSNNPMYYADPLGDTISPGTAVRTLAAMERSMKGAPGKLPGLNIFSLLPQTATGDKIAGVMTGVGESVVGMGEGIYSLTTDPVGTFKGIFKPSTLNPFAQTPEEAFAMMKPYMDNVSAFGEGYANFHLYGKVATDVGSITLPVIRWKAPYAYTAEMAAIDYAILEAYKPGRPAFRVVSAMEAEGKIAIDVNGSHFPTNVNGGLGLKPVSTEKWGLLQCAEPKALNTLLNSGASKSSVSSATFGLKTGKTYRGSGVMSDLNFISDRLVFPKAPCTNCSFLLQGTKTFK